MALYVPHQVEALRSYLFSLVGVHIPLFFSLRSAENFQLMWLEKRGRRITLEKLF